MASASLVFYLWEHFGVGNVCFIERKRKTDQVLGQPTLSVHFGVPNRASVGEGKSGWHGGSGPQRAPGVSRAQGSTYGRSGTGSRPEPHRKWAGRWEWGRVVAPN